MGQGREKQPLGKTSERGDAILAALRSYGAISTEIGRHFAGSLDLHPSDASALIEILEAEERATPLSPARLSERIGLSSGATSSLLNRLEEAGHIVRSRIHTDRRIVTLQSTPAVQKIAKGFFDPLGESLSAMMRTYPDELLQEFEAFLAELHSATQAYVEDISS